MTPTDRMKAALVAIVEAVIGPRLDLRAAYRCRVVLQHADGTLDVVPDNQKIPSLTKVPIRYGAPGESAKVRAGAYVFVEFLEGDASKPCVRGWESASVIERTVTADMLRLADGDRELARKGDSVVVILGPTAAGKIMGGGGGVGTGVPLTGYILDGCPKVKGP